jgi:hypothetical protein
MRRLCGILLAINTLAIVGLLLWAVQAEVVWIWLFFGSLVLLALQRFEPNRRKA